MFLHIFNGAKQMPIDIDHEQIVSLTEATKIIPKRNGKRPAIATLWRWCRQGVRGVHLEYIRMGRNLATSREAINRFFNALASADQPTTAKPLVPLQAEPAASSAVRRASLTQADRILERAGI